jgi:hypothetical protein
MPVERFGRPSLVGSVFRRHRSVTNGERVTSLEIDSPAFVEMEDLERAQTLPTSWRWKI